MSKPTEVINVVVAGLGGQGVLTSSDVLAEAALAAGFDVKKSEVHGMSQRGGSVRTDVRFGGRVASPMIPVGEADFLVLQTADERPVHEAALRDGAIVLVPELVDAEALPSKKTANIALLGVLSRYLDIPAAAWHAAIKACLPEAYVAMNLEAFDIGRRVEPTALEMTP